jgi:hypothetical protein
VVLSDSISMADLFYSPRLTLVRAQHHIRDFSQAVREFVTSKPWTHVVDQDPDTGQHIHKIRIDRQLPEMLPCILFDATNNMRAALDQAGYASAIAAGSPSLKAIKFPFSSCEEKFRDHVAGACKDLPPQVCEIFASYQPYRGGNDTLWALNEIANAKKHLALKPLAMRPPSVFYTADVIGDGWRSEIVSPGGAGIGWDPEEREVTLAITPPGVQPRITTDVTFDIAIEGVDAISRQQASHVLNAMSGIVGRILIATEAECRRLGFRID